jgi:hypothetical protein
MGALRCADGAFVVGEMGGHTSNAGRIYFPSGTPDLNDIRDGALDIPGSVTRELEEETGLAPGEYESDPDWHCIYTGTALAMIRLLRIGLPGEVVRERIERNLAAQDQPELSAIHLVRGPRDLSAAMPRFVADFLKAQFAA